MATNEEIENFRNAVEVGDEETVSELAYDMPPEVLKKALLRCECLVRKTRGGYKGTRDIVSEALKQRTR
jgi:hypothetical protein